MDINSRNRTEILIQRLESDKTWTNLLKELDKVRTILKTNVLKDQVFIDSNLFVDKIEEFFDDYLARLITNNGILHWELLTLISNIIIPTNKRTWIEMLQHLRIGLFAQENMNNGGNQLSINNNELLDALIFGYEGPLSAESFLHRDDIFILDKVIKCFSDPLIFSKSNQKFQLYEDHILATLSQASRDLSGRARLRHLAGFVGLTTTKAMYYDEIRGE